MTIRHLLLFAIVLYWLFPSDISAQNYTVINNASIYSGCNCYQLTPAVNNQGGGVYENNTINLNNSFDYTFNVFLGCNDAGADGIVFILTNNITQIGAQGGGLGYLGLPGNSLAIEYDTYQNSQDPSYDHIAMESAGGVSHNVAGPVGATPGNGNIEDCAYHTTEIIWNVNTQTYSVYFDGSLRLTYTGNIVANFFGGNPVVNWGWSGSTGGGNNDQRFCITQISNWVAGTNYESCSKTLQFSDVSTTNVGTVQSWAWNFGEPASGASNTSTQQNPTHTYAANGSYTVTLTITDITGCANTYSHVVTINAPITISPTLTQPLCNGGANGSIAIASSGGFGAAAGFGGYSYKWSNTTAVTTSNQLGLTSGTYNVTVTDGVCSATGSYLLNQPAALTASTSHVDASCGASNGSVTMVISGGTPPYYGPLGAPQQPTWNGVQGTTRSGLPAGTYVADFDDSHGCSALLTYRETVASLPCGYSFSTTHTDVKCFGASTGTATLTASGGTSPVIYWTNNANGATVSNAATAVNLPAGTYTYHYSAPSPTYTGTVVINQPGAAMVASLTTTNTTCSYLNNGSAVASVTANGTPGYSYAWSASGQPNAATANGLSPGTITVTVTDANTCTATASGTVSGQPALTASVTVMNDSCYLAKKGSATVSAGGGTPVYSYLWNNSPTAIGSTDYGIGAGTYTVTVTDRNSCTITASGIVAQPLQLTEVLTQSNVACYGGTGSATITPSGGNGGFVYAWSGGGSPTSNTDAPLTPGKYYVTVTDSKLCKVNDSVTITQPIAAFTVGETVVNVKCKGAASGSITLAPTGGTSPYGTVNWGGGVTGLTRTGLTAGSYSYTATDANGCSVTNTINITEPATAFTVGEAVVNVKCKGDATGSITLAPTGGTTPYGTISWGGGVTGPTRTGLTAGSYSYTAIDANSCSVTNTVTITEPTNAFTVGETVVNVKCKGAASGSITLAPTGGTTPYGTISWGGGVTGSTRTGLVAGSYSYTASDANSCSVTNTINITEPANAFTVGETITNVKCKGAASGSITLAPTGGTTPYGTISWGGGVTGSTRTGLVAGSYSYTASDANSCSVTNTINITEPANAFTVGETITNVKCKGDATGAITLAPTGGTTPYGTVSWGGGVTGNTRIGLVAGSYSYTATDANSCSVTNTVTITEPANTFTVGETVVNVNCKGGATGSITLAPTGGTTPYGTISWGGGVTGPTRTGLVAGSYSYTATDANSCSVTNTINITEPATAFTVGETVVNVKCKGDATGAITLAPTGGTTPYGTISWGGGITGMTRTVLIAGSYSYTATDANSCSVTNTVTITEPANAFTVGETVVNVNCKGGATGSITLAPAGGTTPYGTISWGGGVTGPTRTGLVAGSYSYTASDANSCSVTNTINITEPANAFTVGETITNVKCKGDATGAITLAAAGGTTPYGTIDWGGGITGPTRTGLVAGNYTYTATDANSCSVTNTVNITEPANAFTVGETITNVKCKGDATGAITLAPAGGTTPYGIIDWGGGITGPTRTGLVAGNYTYTATDANSCSVSNTVNITEPATTFSVTEAHTDVVCFGNNTGAITLTLSNGTTPYAGVDWGGGITGTTRTALVAGSYSYTATDANGCSATGTVNITQPATGGITVTVTETDATCSYNNDGSATASSTGGVSPYNYAWSNNFSQTGVATSTATGLAANTYTVVVTDQNGCTAGGSTTVSSQPKITAQLAVTNVSCYGGATGAISVTPGGGTGSGYHYTWSANTATGDQPAATGLAAGTYLVTITDGNNCELDTFATVAQPAAALSFTSPVFVRNVSCNGGNNGAIKYVVSGGTAPYTFIWSGSATGSNDSAINLTANTYDVTITDANSCRVLNSIAVTEPLALSITSQSQTNITCHGGNNGTATVNVTGGTPGAGYTYTWTPNVSLTNTASTLTAGTYAVVITDANQCTISASFTITDPPALSATASATNALCHGGSTGSVVVTASGGTPASTGYTYTWSPNVSTTSTATAVPAGTYSVVVTDSLLCTTMATAQVGEPAALTAILDAVVNISCSRDTDGQIQLSASGGVSPYQYGLSPDGFTFTPSNTGSFTDLKGGSYAGRVTDANGCTSTVLASIIAPDSVTVVTTIDTVKCFGDKNGALTISASGGTPDYVFTFSDGVSNGTGIDQPLAAGFYSFTVTDARGCVQTYDSINVSQPDSLQIFSTPADPTIGLTESVDLQASSNASTSIVYTWSPATGLSNTEGSNTVATTYQTTTYTLTGTIKPHGKECTTSIKVPVTVVPKYDVYIPNAFTPNGDGVNDYFEMFGDKKAFKLVDVEVFDRWGEKVYESNDINFKWDGTYRGTRLEPGIFIYQISVVFVNDHAESGYKGSITILR